MMQKASVFDEYEGFQGLGLSAFMQLQLAFGCAGDIRQLGDNKRFNLGRIKATEECYFVAASIPDSQSENVFRQKGDD